MNNTELFNGNINEIKENHLLITPSSDIFCVIKLEDNQFYWFLFKQYNESYYWEKFSLLTENSYLLSHSMIENINNISYSCETQKLEKIDNNILDLFKTFGFDFQIIKCGGDKSNFKLREQLTDGANSFALDIGKIIIYSCNDRTIEELEKNGYHHITSYNI